jgi:hypothetical protein
MNQININSNHCFGSFICIYPCPSAVENKPKKINREGCEGREDGGCAA